MRIIVPASLVTFAPTSNTIALDPPFNKVKEVDVLRIRDDTTNEIIYDRDNRSSSITVSNGVISYTYANTYQSSGDDLQVELSSNFYAPPYLLLLSSSIAFAANDTLTIEKYTEVLDLPSLPYSGNCVVSVTRPLENTAGDLTIYLYNQNKTNTSDIVDDILEILTVEMVTGAPTNRDFIVSGLGAGEGTIKVGAKFAADSGAATVHFTVRAL